MNTLNDDQRIDALAQRMNSGTRSTQAFHDNSNPQIPAHNMNPKDAERLLQLLNETTPSRTNTERFRDNLTFFSCIIVLLLVYYGVSLFAAAGR